MMNMMSGAAAPSLADIAAVTRNNGEGSNGWGDGNGWWVLIILFALFGGWGRGYGAQDGGGSGGNSGTIVYDTGAGMQRAFDTQSIITKLDGLNSGICSLGYDQLAQMNNIQNAVTQASINEMQNTNAIQAQLANCCCENRQAIAQVRYDMAQDTCAVTNAINGAARDIIQNDNANYRQLHDEMVAAQIAAKDEKIAEQASLIQSLNLAQSQANQNNYISGLIENAINTLRPCPTPAYLTCNPWASQEPYGSCRSNAGCGCNNNSGCCNGGY